LTRILVSPALSESPGEGAQYIGFPHLRSSLNHVQMSTEWAHAPGASGLAGPQFMETDRGSPRAKAEKEAEKITFSVRTALMYTPLPPSTSLGHRAELWDVEKPFKELKLTVVEQGERMFIRLLDAGELFAECPLPSDGSPLIRAVEPAVDSSRYFVLRVVDRESGDERKHAFVGLGFRERSEASAFTAAIDDYRISRRKSDGLVGASVRQTSSSGLAPINTGPNSASEVTDREPIRPGRAVSGASAGYSPFEAQGQASKDVGVALAEPDISRMSIERKSIDATRPKLQRVFSLDDEKSFAGVRILAPPSATSQHSGCLMSNSPSAVPDWAVFGEFASGRPSPSRPSPSPSSSAPGSSGFIKQHSRNASESSGQWGEL